MLLSVHRRCACGSPVTRNTASLQEPKAALSSAFLSGANKQLLMSSWAYVLDVITTRMSALGTGLGADTRSLQADSCMGSFSIRGCLRKEKENPATQPLLKPACPGPGDSQVQPRGHSLLAGRAVRVCSAGTACRVLPCSGCTGRPEEKAQGPQEASGLLVSLVFASPRSHWGEGGHAAQEWASALGSYRLGSEPRFCSLLAV